MEQKRYRVEIVEIKTGDVVSVVGRNLNESRAERREMTALQRTNLKDFFVRIVDEGGENGTV